MLGDLLLVKINNLIVLIVHEFRTKKTHNRGDSLISKDKVAFICFVYLSPPFNFNHIERDESNVIWLVMIHFIWISDYLLSTREFQIPRI